MSRTLVQRSFASGEVAPALYGRADVNKYQNALRKAVNGYVMRHGGFTNRAGSEFLAEASDSTKQVRIIPFVYSLDQKYALEFGDEYMRVIKDGAYIYEAAKNITGVNTGTDELTVTSHGYTTGDEVYVESVGGLTFLNNRQFKIVSTGANTLTLTYMDGSAVDLISGYTSGGTIKKVYEIDTPYAHTDLFDLRYTQSANLMTITSNDYEPRDLYRTADDAWTISETSFSPNTARPTGVSASSGGGGSTTQRYAVTAIDPETREESLKGLQAASNLTTPFVTLSGSSPVRFTDTSHGFQTGDQVFVESITGITGLADKEYFITRIDANNYDLNDTDSSDYSGTATAGVVKRCHATLTSVAAPSSGSAHTITWTEVSGVQEYSVYREQNGVFGYIGTATGATFSDTGITPDMTETPPSLRNPFLEESPGCVAYYQQRRVFGNLESKPEYVYCSRTGRFTNFTVSSPIQEDDAVTFNLVGNRVNRVRSIISLQRMIVFTEAGVHVINGNEAGVLTPSGINPTQISYSGANNLEPLVIQNSALYVQARGSVVRDLVNDAAEGQKGVELSLLSAHLVDGYQIVDWAYQEIPHSIVWIVRDDGALLSMTYVKDQQIVGWARHDLSGGEVESVCVVPASSEDEVYLVVKREIDGREVRYIERLHTRQIDDVKDFVFCDSSLSYDGRHTGSTTMTLSGGTNWTSSETLTLTASAAAFAASDVGNQVHLTGSDGTIIRFTINEYDALSSGTIVTGKAHKTVPVSMRSTAISTWGLAVDVVSGLWHLEGEDVAILGDGFVEASPNNTSYIIKTVTNGSVTLSQPYTVVHVGLSYCTDLQTLDIDTPQGESLASKKMNASRITAFFEKTRGVFVGVNEPTGDDKLDGLQELKIREDEGYDDAVDLLTGKSDVTIESEWNNHGRVFIRQVDPLPMTVLAIMPEGLFPVGGN